MKIAIAAAAILALTCPAVWAHPRLSIEAEGRAHRVATPGRATVFVGEPGARIRAASGRQGLGPLAFAKWVAANPALLGPEAARLRHVAGTTSLLNRSAELFAGADRNGDRRISAIELADFIASPASTLSGGRTT